MVRGTKIAVVIAGYAVAVVAAVVAAWLYDVRVAGLPYDTSGGMYAGGQLLQSLAAFFLVALVPTLVGLWFLRGHERFWNAVAMSSLAFAVIGLVAALATLASGGSPRNLPLVLLELLGLAQLLGVPIWFAAFALFTVFAPTRRSRNTLALAVLVEMVIGVCAFFHWFAPGSRL
jgi:hypothetical protein